MIHLAICFVISLPLFELDYWDLHKPVCLKFLMDKNKTKKVILDKSFNTKPKLISSYERHILEINRT